MHKITHWRASLSLCSMYISQCFGANITFTTPIQDNLHRLTFLCRNIQFYELTFILVNIDITDDERRALGDFTTNSNIRIAKVKPEWFQWAMSCKISYNPLLVIVMRSESFISAVTHFFKLYTCYYYSHFNGKNRLFLTILLCRGSLAGWPYFLH